MKSGKPNTATPKGHVSPKKAGSLISPMSFGGLAVSAPRKPQSQGGGLVGGMSPTFGVGKAAGAKSGSRPSRKKMY